MYIISYSFRKINKNDLFLKTLQLDSSIHLRDQTSKYEIFSFHPCKCQVQQQLLNYKQIFDHQGSGNFKEKSPYLLKVFWSCLGFEICIVLRPTENWQIKVIQVFTSFSITKINLFWSRGPQVNSCCKSIFKP